MPIVSIDGNNYFDQTTLLDRLSEGVSEENKEVVFVVGAPLTATSGDVSGVADVAGVVELIRQEFAPQALKDLDLELQGAANKYQAAFTFLQGRRSQDRANGVIRQAVWQANKGFAGDVSAIRNMTEEELSALDNIRRVEGRIYRSARKLDT